MFFDVDLSPSQADLDVLSNGLAHHAKPIVDEPGFKPLAIFMRDDNHDLCGGVAGTLNWNWLYVSLLWIAKPQRGAGHGRDLMRRIEQIAMDRGCEFSHLDTFSFQAQSFYESQGYGVFAKLDNYPRGHTRLFMKKVLVRAAGSS